MSCPPVPVVVVPVFVAAAGTGAGASPAVLLVPHPVSSSPVTARKPADISGIRRKAFLLIRSPVLLGQSQPSLEPTGDATQEEAGTNNVAAGNPATNGGDSDGTSTAATIRPYASG